MRFSKLSFALFLIVFFPITQSIANPNVTVEGFGKSVNAVVLALQTKEAVAAHIATGTNAAATITIAAAGADVSNLVSGVSWSYNGLPTGGRITISDGETIVYDIDITAAGTGFLPVMRKGSANTAMTVTLAAGGSGVVGKINLDAIRSE